jgi:hypothetical protein
MLKYFLYHISRKLKNRLGDDTNSQTETRTEDGRELYVRLPVLLGKGCLKYAEEYQKVITVFRKMCFDLNNSIFYFYPM